MRMSFIRRLQWRRVGISCALLAVGVVAMVLVVRATSCQSGWNRWGPSYGWVESPRSFPVADEPLAPSTPLAPLLSQVRQQKLALIEPLEGTTRVGIGQPLVLRFNRPMVARDQLHSSVDDPPFTFRPLIKGDTQWSSPTTLVFQPEPSTWTTTRTCDFLLDAPLTSASGETLVDERVRRVVFDATPRFVRREGSSRVSPGAPVRLLFEGNLRGAGLEHRLLVYETGGGNRRLPFTLRPGREDENGLTPVTLGLRTALSPGSSFAVALSPTLASGHNHPHVLNFNLAPSPRIEGIACPESAESVDGCRYRQPPQGIIDFGDALVLFASAPLRSLAAHDVTIRPPVANLSTQVEAGHRLVLRADWAPDQVYEVRVHKLYDVEGSPLSPTPPLAVRSRGREPEVRVATGRRTYERDAEPEIHFGAVHVDEGAIQIAPVTGLPDARHVLQPDSRFAMWRSNAVRKHALGDFVPTARPNRWGAGTFPWFAPELELTSNMAFVSFVPRLPSQDDTTVPGRSTVFVQRTDLGLQAKMLPSGTHVWVTSIQSAHALDSVAVNVTGADGRKLGSGKTDASGALWIPGRHGHEPIVVEAQREQDRAVLVVDPRTAVGPNHFGMHGGQTDKRLEMPVAFVFADRGIARPGETIHAKAIVFQRGRATDSLHPIRNGTLRLEVSVPGREAPLFARSMRPNRWGTIATDFVIESEAPLGDYRIKVHRPGFEQPIGEAGFSVRQVRQPVFHIDLDAESRDIVDGEPMPTKVRAVHPFGAPAAGKTARWVLTRSSGGQLPSRWRGFVFGPVDGRTREGSVERGEARLDGQGEATLDLRAASSVPMRETATLEVAVQDIAGREAAARTSFRWYPAAFEVAQQRRSRWVERDETLSIDAVAIARDGTPLVGRSLSARFVREGWRRFWTWNGQADSTRGENNGGYRLRTAQRRGEVHRCNLVSEREPVSCTYQPTKAGAYLLEVEAQDEAGRYTVSSQRVYVAAPDERPDRDPPGAALTLSPHKAKVEVGENAEIAFESPFPDAEVLVTVERDTVLSAERRRVGSGGQTIRIPVTQDMVPNAFVYVSLVRPRTGPPGDKVDLHAPDLRFGATELSIVEPNQELVVEVQTPESEARAGRELPVQVEVKDRQGQPVQCEVALFAVDEGTLRLTGTETPDPAKGLSPRLGPSFSWDGLRRTLVSRITPSLPAVMGGGGVMHQAPAKVELRDAFEPTPLWAPQLETDEAGKASASFVLPKRAAEYRIMAVAVDDRARRGCTESKLVAVRDIVVQPSLPRFVREGDHFDATLVVHNTRNAAIDLRFTPEIDGQRGETRTMQLAARGHERLSVPVAVTSSAALRTRFEVRTDDDDATVQRTIPIRPRGRWEQAFVVGALRGRHDMDLSFPPGAFPEGSRLELATAAHPLVGFTEAVEMLEASPYAGAETAASALIGQAAYASLGEVPRQSQAGRELAARAGKTIRRLVAYQHDSGAFAHVVTSGNLDPYLTAHALHALMAAKSVGWDVPRDAIESATDRLQSYVLCSTFLDDDMNDGRNDLAFALRVLAEAEASEPDRVSALYEQREHLSAFGLAQLALAMSPDDDRRRSLVSDALRMVTATREDERTSARILRWWQPAIRSVAAVVEAASAEDGFDEELRGLVSTLVRSRMQGRWCSGYETSVSLQALRAYAARFERTTPPRVTLKLDGQEVQARQGAESHWLSLPIGAGLVGEHRLTIESDRPAFFALSSRWVVPLDDQDDVARGRGVTLHRVLQTFDGKRIGKGDTLRVGDLVRVRLLLFNEETTPRHLVLTDPLAAGFEPVDEGLDTSPQESVRALLGRGADDAPDDPALAMALSSSWSVEHRAFDKQVVTYHLNSLGTGLHEFTYGVRATVSGAFSVPPASLRARYVPQVRRKKRCGQRRGEAMKIHARDAGRWLRRTLRRRAILPLLVVVLGLVAWWSPLRLQLIDIDRFSRPVDAVTVLDRHGTPLRHARVDGIDRRWVPIEDVSPHVIAAFVAVEDHRFWDHDGVDWRSVLRAAFTNGIPGRRLSGASTITQQVIKLVYRRPLGLLSKFVEVLRAWVLEEQMSKSEILEQYVNRVPFGDRIHGVARASEAYFGRPVSDLTVAQAALLAGIPQAPSVTEPRRHLARATRRRNVVLRSMLNTGAIDVETYALSVREPVRVVGASVRPYEAPRYVDRALLAWKQGRVSVRDGRLRTTLDLRLQLDVEAITGRRVLELGTRGVTNGAAMVIANESGEVLAYVGAAQDGPDAPGGQLDLLRRRRQPGSTLKPFVYAQLFERGGTPATLLDDTARPMTTAFGEEFAPHDYDRHERGPVRARVALASSLNLPALDASRRVGAESVARGLRRLSFSHVRSAQHHGAGIVLGGVDVTGEQLAHAYVALARAGRWIGLGWSTREQKRVFSQQAAVLVADILRDGRARADGFGRDLEDLAGGPFALKTGTSTAWRDAWAVAFDEHHTVVVWLGDPAGRALSAVSGFVGSRSGGGSSPRRCASPNRSQRSGARRDTRCGVGLASSVCCHWFASKRALSSSSRGAFCNRNGAANTVQGA